MTYNVSSGTLSLYTTTEDAIFYGSTVTLIFPSLLTTFLFQQAFRVLQLLLPCDCR